MKRITLALLAATGLAVSAAHADHVSVSGSFNYGAPVYVAPAPVYNAPIVVAEPRGYWRDEAIRVWIAPHWELRTDRWGRSFRAWEPGHYEMRNNRVWVGRYSDHDRRGHWDNRRFDDRRDDDDRRWNR